MPPRKRAEVPKPCPDCAGSRDGPIVHAAQPQPAAEGSLAYRPGTIRYERQSDPTTGEPLYRWISTPSEPAADPLSTVATALCMAPDELARDMAALVTPAAYLRLLRDKDAAAWRERIKAVYGACDGNAHEVARRIGLTYRGLAKLVASDPELRQAIAIRWPHTQRSATHSTRGHTEQR